MIRVLAQGRLGNQMFQYAFGYAAGKKLGTKFIFKSTLLWNVFELDAPRWWTISRTLVLFAFMRLRYRRTVISVDNLTPPPVVLADLKDGVVYSGYFQSEQFFFDSRAEIQKHFTFLPKYEREFSSRYGELVRQFSTVVVHVRRTDYAGFHLFGSRESIVLPWAYFRACLDRIEHLERYQVIFISDEIDAVEREFQDIPGAEFSRNNPIVDFQLLRHADIAILSNSSFSWWGAYLNPKNPRVLAPRDWIGFGAHVEYPAGVLLDGWEIVDVPLSNIE